MDFSYIDKNAAKIRERLELAAREAGRDPSEITLLAAVKYATPEEIEYLCRVTGVTHIGENRVQQLTEHLEGFNKLDTKLHFIGTLQTNKLKYIIDKVDMIESVDSLKLAAEIDRQAKKHGVVMDVLCEINIGKEETKTGFFAEEVLDALKQISALQNLKVSGLMAIPPRSLGKEYFPQMQELFLKCKEKSENFSVLSMGMSDDYEQAIAYGATEVRLGRALFGERVISKIL